MTPVELTWPGSDDLVTISRSPNKTYEDRDFIAEFLSSRYPQFWAMEDDPTRPGEKMSIDQRGKWRAVLADVFYVNGPVLIATRLADGKPVMLAAAIAKPTRSPLEAELLVQSTDGYASRDVDPRMLAELKAECLNNKPRLVLGRAEMQRKWVPL